MRTRADLLAASPAAPVRTLARSTAPVARLQGLIGNRATARLMRQATVAHASPRWSDAPTSEEADRRNQELSERRMQTIRGIIDARLRTLLGPDAQIDYDLDVVDSGADGVSIDSEAHGSRDTLHSAHGNRKSNDPWFRRVDVTIDDGATVQETAGQTAGRSVKEIKSKHWRVQTGLTVTGAYGVSAGALTFTIQNADTGRSGEYYLVGGGMGTPGFGVSVDPSRSWSDFETKTEVGFSDFDGVNAAYVSGGVGLWFVDYEDDHLDIPSLVDDAIDISGFDVGAGLGLIEVTYVDGYFASKGTAPSDYYDVSDPHDEEVPYQRRDTRSDLHYAFFETGSAALGAQAQKDLVEFVDGASRRYTGGP
jgi:hypothetical protein